MKSDEAALRERPPTFEFGDFRLDVGARKLLRRDGAEVELGPRLFDALLFFVERKGELLDKDALLAALWPGLVVEENNVNQLVSGLRRALGDDAQSARYIQTVPRRVFASSARRRRPRPRHPQRPGPRSSRRRGAASSRPRC